MASGIVHKIQTQHHALSSEHSKHLFGHASLRRQQLYRRKVGMQASVGKLPLQEDDYLIVGTITVGTPPQSFNVEVDAFFDNELLLIGANANLSSVSKYIPKKNTYNASSSSTYVAVDGNISSYHKAQDVLNIGSLSATIKSFVVVDKVPYLLNYYPIDGILGLAPVKDSQFNVSVVADDLIDQLDQPLISIYSNSGGNGTGQVTLGAEDSDNCQSTWSYVPAIDYFRKGIQYAIHASSAEVTIGGQLTTVNMDSNVTFVPWFAFEAPFQAKDAFVNGTGASYNASIGEYTIDCDTTKAPLITLNLGGVGNSTDSTSRKLVLSGADYIRYWKRMNVCYLGVTFYFDYASHREFILGSQVLNNHCISFNYKERTVGFSDSKTPKTDVTKA
ncbi:eukaryotic aspartyl protease domain-containing protein [Ditylenchus destructor]|uniref:Eukaryotic aspartyl protease domain-containing protein n=1 Tax=Ditylenchus destructor TaxID=166010 RepID=A0AAD4MQ63_9BILA|nr:eukaryotic aspartyl protease domain-containing protein [Ditylenchus destructor]